MSTNERAHIRVDQIRPLTDDVEIKPTMAVRFKLCDMLGHFLPRTARTPDVLHFVDDDDRTIGHIVGPLRGVLDGDVRDLQLGDAKDIERAVLAKLAQH
ncbi:hypothetical protein D3C71_1724680 [compost metagenome]